MSLKKITTSPPQRSRSLYQNPQTPAGNPTAKEMETNGITLGEMNMLSLKKIEELTLHVINIQKRVNELKRENKFLKAEHK